MKRHPTCHKMAPQEVWKWCPTCYEMAPDELENVNQCCFNKFDCRLFVSKFSQFTFHLFLSHSVISKSLAQPFCKCYSLSLSIVLNARFTTNGMCVTEMSGLWNFSVRVQSWPDKIEYEPVLIRKFLKFISPIQSWSTSVKSFIFVLPHEAKELLKLFYLLPITIVWRENTSSRAFASWGKIDTAFQHFQNLTRKFLLGIWGKSTAGVIFPLGESNWLDWSSDKDDKLGLV